MMMMNQEEELMESPEQEAAEAPEEDMQEGESNPKAVRQELESKLQPGDQRAYERIVLAGLKIMFSEQTHKMALRQVMNAEGETADKLAQAVADLLGMLYEQSKGSLPPNLILPAAMAFLTHGLEFMEKAGMETEGLLEEATMVLFPTVLKKFGMQDEQLRQMFSGGFNQAPVDQKAQGIVGGAMNA